MKYSYVFLAALVSSASAQSVSNTDSFPSEATGDFSKGMKPTGSFGGSFPTGGFGGQAGGFPSGTGNFNFEDRVAATGTGSHEQHSKPTNMPSGGFGAAAASGGGKQSRSGRRSKTKSSSETLAARQDKFQGSPSGIAKQSGGPMAGGPAGMAKGSGMMPSGPKPSVSRLLYTGVIPGRVANLF